MNDSTLPKPAPVAKPYVPADRRVEIIETRPDGQTYVVILATVLQRLAAIGHDPFHARAALLRGEVLKTSHGMVFCATAKSLFEVETGRQVQDAPDWFHAQLSLCRGRTAVRKTFGPAMAELEERLFHERCEAEFIAQGAEQREEGGVS